MSNELFLALVLGGIFAVAGGAGIYAALTPYPPKVTGNGYARCGTGPQTWKEAAVSAPREPSPPPAAGIAPASEQAGSPTSRCAKPTSTPETP